MSTQKRENRWQRKTCTEHASAWVRLNPALVPALIRLGCANAFGKTAPLLSLLFWWTWAWLTSSDNPPSLGEPDRLATKFLHLDRLNRHVVQPVLEAHRRGSPPFAARRHAGFGTVKSVRSFLPLLPFPSGFAPLPLRLPQAPAAYRRRAERYDGKRDMYLLHAA